MVRVLLLPARKDGIAGTGGHHPVLIEIEIAGTEETDGGELANFRV